MTRERTQPWLVQLRGAAQGLLLLPGHTKALGSAPLSACRKIYDHDAPVSNTVSRQDHRVWEFCIEEIYPSLCQDPTFTEVTTMYCKCNQEIK